MTMHVTYEALDKTGASYIKKTSTTCYSHIFTERGFGYEVHTLVKHAKKNKKYVNFWMNVCKTIEPGFITYDRNGELYAKIPLLKQGKMRIILTILRYLWEDSNGLYHIVEKTYKILLKYRWLDPLSAITLAASINLENTAYGHAHIYYIADVVPTISDYRDYKDKQGYRITWGKYTKVMSLVEKRNKLKKLIDKDPDKEISIAMSYFKILKNKEKYTNNYGSINFDRRFPWNWKIKVYHGPKRRRNRGVKT